MKIVYNKVLPCRGFLGINLFGILFVREEYRDKVPESILNHEKIHTEQQKEMLYIFFYVWYLIEWFARLVIQPRYAYRGISFEQEAYDNQTNPEYLKNRKRYAWLKYLIHRYDPKK